MSTAEKQKYNAVEYLERERAATTRSEFYQGEVFSMAGASREHNLIVTNCVGELRNALRDRGCEIYPNDMRVKIAASGLYTYPDVAIVCGEPRFEDDQFDTLINPLLVIEVLSESTEKYDRGFKSAQYRLIPSLREIVLISQYGPGVECLARQENGLWILREQRDIDQTIFLESLQITISLNEIYRQVVFSSRIPPLQDHPPL
jgi:Uma2 family endonuclease